MAAAVADILLDEDDTAPDPSQTLGALGAEPAKRGRGRPRGSRTKQSAARPAGAAPISAGARELAQLCKQALGGLSLGLALFLGVDELAMTGGEAQDIARPLARILLRSSYAAQVLALANKGGDWGQLLWASTLYGVRIYPLIVQRQQQLELARQAQQQQRGLHRVPTGQNAGVREQQQQQQAPANAASDPESDAARVAALANLASNGYGGLADVDAFAAGHYRNVGNLAAANPSN